MNIKVTFSEPNDVSMDVEFSEEKRSIDADSGHGQNGNDWYRHTAC